MNVVMLNGSPRGKRSNTQLLLSQILIGMQAVNDVNAETYYLQQTAETDTHLRAVQAADLVLLGFPLYTDGMPGITKHFIEALSPIDMEGKPFAFLVQSGFPEARHSRPVAKYLERLCQRIHATHCGTIIRGGSEGVHLGSEKSNRKIYAQFNALGASLAYDGRFRQDLLDKVAGPEKLNGLMRVVFQLNLSNFYWDMMLKQNNAYDNRFDAPYAPAYSPNKEK